MGSLFSPKVPKPQTPAVKRMPSESDPNVLAAAERTRETALRRRGRLSTILTDQTQSIGSSGQKLGA
jgi:hypothetical protein